MREPDILAARISVLQSLAKAAGTADEIAARIRADTGGKMDLPYPTVVRALGGLRAKRLVARIQLPSAGPGKAPYRYVATATGLRVALLEGDLIRRVLAERGTIIAQTAGVDL